MRTSSPSQNNIMWWKLVNYEMRTSTTKITVLKFTEILRWWNNVCEMRTSTKNILMSVLHQNDITLWQKKVCKMKTRKGRAWCPSPQDVVARESSDTCVRGGGPWQNWLTTTGLWLPELTTRGLRKPVLWTEVAASDVVVVAVRDIAIDVLLLTYCSKDGMDMFTYESPHESL